MEGLSYTPPHTKFAGDSGQERNTKEPVFPVSHRHIQSVRQPLFWCVRQSLLSRGDGAGGWLVVTEVLRCSPCQRGDGQGLLVLEIPSSSKTPWPGEGLLDFEAGGCCRCPRVPPWVGGGSGSAHLAMQLWPARGTSGRADVGAQRGGHRQLCGSTACLPPSPYHGLQVSPWAAVRWDGGDVHDPCPAIGLGWILSLGGPGGPWAGQSLARHRDLLFVACGAELQAWKDHMVPSAPA